MLGTTILEERKSKFNGNIRVLETWGMGTYIQAEGLTQSGGIVEEIWKSTLKKISHQPLTINNCLILGFGGGTVAKLIRKQWPNAKIAGVDIDPVIVELGKKYLGLDETEVIIKITDAANLPNFPNHPNQKYDLVIVDLYNGDKFPAKFATENYIHLVRSLLARSGVVIFNRLRYKNKKEEAENFGRKLQKHFKKVEYYYPPANLMLICSN